MLLFPIQLLDQCVLGPWSFSEFGLLVYMVLAMIPAVRLGQKDFPSSNYWLPLSQTECHASAGQFLHRIHSALRYSSGFMSSIVCAPILTGNVSWTGLATALCGTPMTGGKDGLRALLAWAYHKGIAVRHFYRDWFWFPGHSWLENSTTYRWFYPKALLLLLPSKLWAFSPWHSAWAAGWWPSVPLSWWHCSVISRCTPRLLVRNITFG